MGPGPHPNAPPPTHAQAPCASESSSGQGPPVDLTSLTFTPPITYRKLLRPFNSNRYITPKLYTKVYCLQLYGYFLQLLTVLNEIYPHWYP